MVYILLFLILFINSMCYFLNNKPLKKYIYICSNIYIYIFATFRWQNWTDWDQYHDYFMYMDKTLDSAYEIFYILFNKLIYNVFPNYTFFLAIYNLIILYSIHKFIKTYVDDEYRLITIIPTYLIILYSGGNRQFLAISILLIGLCNLNNRKYLRFILCVVLATLFHKTAMIAILFLVVKKIEIKEYKYKKSTMLIMFILTIIASYYLVDIFQPILERLSNQGDVYIAARLKYMDDIGYVEPGKALIYQLTSILKQVVLFIMLLMVLKKNKIILEQKEKFLYNSIILGNIIFIFTSSPNNAGIKRFYLYFKIFELITVYLFIKYSNNKLRSYCFVTILNFLYMIYIIAYTYPELYLPYNIFLQYIN